MVAPSSLWLRLNRVVRESIEKVYAVRRERVPRDGSKPTIDALVLRSLPIATIALKHVPDTTSAQTPESDNPSHRGQEYTTVALTIAAPIVGSIPLVGPHLKAAIGGLLEILKVIDVSSVLRRTNIS